MQSSAMRLLRQRGYDSNSSAVSAEKKIWSGGPFHCAVRIGVGALLRCAHLLVPAVENLIRQPPFAPGRRVSRAALRSRSHTDAEGGLCLAMHDRRARKAEGGRRFATLTGARGSRLAPICRHVRQCKLRRPRAAAARRSLCGSVVGGSTTCSKEISPIRHRSDSPIAGSITAVCSSSVCHTATGAISTFPGRPRRSRTPRSAQRSGSACLQLRPGRYSPR